MNTSLRFALAALALGVFPATAMAATDCLELAVSVKHAVSAEPANVLQIVEENVEANSGCACEVVKAAILASEADAKTVAKIVEVASTVAPDKMRLVSQCAVAVAPDALPDVQALMSRLDPNKGDTGHSSKGSKSPKEVVDVKPAWNPLDFPGQGPVGPTPGGPPMLPPGRPPTVPPVITPPTGTGIDLPIRDFPGTVD
ncbi:hypothetical protein [Luteolibacter marinus]|uniref:hypothetical protein n=1 Tax=Luteolibacter marinus TaxID=2776705 RepID=UPI0018666B0E|nr:hypothetical protein [Luteolibacter marinus]